MISYAIHLDVEFLRAEGPELWTTVRTFMYQRGYRCVGLMFVTPYGLDADVVKVVLDIQDLLRDHPELRDWIHAGSLMRYTDVWSLTPLLEERVVLS